MGTTAADALWRALPWNSVLNPCLDLSPTCLRCATFPEVQAAARLHSTNHLKPQPLPARLTAGDGYCHKVQPEAGNGGKDAKAAKRKAQRPPPPPPLLTTVLSSAEKLKLKKPKPAGHEQLGAGGGSTSKAKTNKRKLLRGNKGA